LADQGIETNLIDPDRETSRRARLTSIREARPPLRGSKRNLGGTAVVQRTVIATTSALDERASSRTRRSPSAVRVGEAGQAARSLASSSSLPN